MHQQSMRIAEPAFIAILGTFVTSKFVRYINVMDEQSGLYLRRRDIFYLVGILFTCMIALSTLGTDKLLLQGVWVTFLLMMSITDAFSEDIYSLFSLGMNLVGSVAVLFQCMESGINISRIDWLSIWVYIIFILWEVAIKGVGIGDMPILTGLLWYHLLFSRQPGITVIIMLCISQILFFTSAILKKKRVMPLVPYIAIAQFITVCFI